MNGEGSVQFEAALVFFICMWTAMLAAGIALVAVSARKKRKVGIRFGVIFLCVIVGLPALFLGVAIGEKYHCADSCAANGVSERDIIGIVFMAVGFCGLLADGLLSIRSWKKYTTPVEATCIELRQGVPVYQIMLHGEQHTLTRESNPRRYHHPIVGETRTLYIDENDLSSFYDPSADKVNRIYLSVFLGVMFTAFILIGALIYFVGR